MKKIFRYIVLLIVVYLVVEIFVYFLTKTYYKDMNNYDILVESPLINVTESKVAKDKGYIEGTATNNTGAMISSLTIKFDFYNENDKYLGSEYHEIKPFNAEEKSKFNIQYEYDEVAEIKISVISE